MFVAATSKTVVVRGAKGSPGESKLRGLDVATGKQKWDFDTAQPPGKKMQASNSGDSGKPPQSSVFHIGDSIVVRWDGMTAESSLKSSKRALYYGVIGMNSGDQRGDLVDGSKFDYGPAHISSANALSLYGNESQGKKGLPFLYADGKVRPTAAPDAKNAVSPKVVPLSPTARLVSFQDTDSGSFQAFKGESPVGKKTECATQAPPPAAPPVAAANGAWMMWGEALISVKKPGRVDCLSEISDNPMTGQVLTDGGDLYFKSKDDPFFLANGSKKPKPLPKDTTVPVAAMESGMVLDISGEGDGGGVVFYKAP